MQKKKKKRKRLRDENPISQGSQVTCHEATACLLTLSESCLSGQAVLLLRENIEKTHTTAQKAQTQLVNVHLNFFRSTVIQNVLV